MAGRHPDGDDQGGEAGHTGGQGNGRGWQHRLSGPRRFQYHGGPRGGRGARRSEGSTNQWPRTRPARESWRVHRLGGGYGWLLPAGRVGDRASVQPGQGGHGPGARKVDLSRSHPPADGDSGGRRQRLGFGDRHRRPQRPGSRHGGRPDNLRQEHRPDLLQPPNRGHAGRRAPDHDAAVVHPALPERDWGNRARGGHGPALVPVAGRGGKARHLGDPPAHRRSGHHFGASRRDGIRGWGDGDGYRDVRLPGGRVPQRC